jgi:hypothetical protein
MKPSSGTLALFSCALCLSLHAQDAATTQSSRVAARLPPARAAASSTNTVGLSDIRIVRLSQVRGKVSIDRHVGRGYEEAFANIPITGGTALRTEVGLAEVEFEDNSTLRLTPDTDVSFAQLKRTAAGSTISSMTVLKGTVYASLANTKGNTFTIAAADATIVLNPFSHIRLTIDGADSNVTVLEGVVQFTDPSSTTTITRNKSLSFDDTGAKPPTPGKVESSAFDQWDKSGNDYQKQYSSLRTSGGTGFLYGSSDLNYYGGFVNMPGCGSLWRPYFVSAAWSPYDNGIWTWYPNAGYSWVSPYPWGWLPFHSGTWMSCGAGGWGWQPGGQWAGLQNLAAASTVSGGRLIPAQPAPPRSGTPAMVPVNSRPLAISSISAPGTFTFRKDSAGLGVPRETFGELKPISSDVAHHGDTSTEIERAFIGPAPAASNGSRSASTRELAPASRGLATFSRPAESRASAYPDDWGGLPRDSLRGPDTTNSSAPRRTQSSSNSPSSAGGSHK